MKYSYKTPFLFEIILINLFLSRRNLFGCPPVSGEILRQTPAKTEILERNLCIYSFLQKGRTNCPLQKF